MNRHNLMLSVLMLFTLGYHSMSQSEDNTKLTWQGGIMKTFDLADQSVEGSYYLVDEFTDAMVYWKVGGDSSKTENGNYHLMLDQFVFMDQDQEKGIGFEKILFFKITMDGAPAIFRHYSSLTSRGFDSKTSYVEQLYFKESQPVSFWRNWFINEVPPNYNEALNTGSKNTMLKRRSQVLLLYNDVWYENFKPKKKQLKEIFDNQAATILDYIKDNSLTDSTSDLQTLGQFINEMLK